MADLANVSDEELAEELRKRRRAESGRGEPPHPWFITRGGGARSAHRANYVRPDGVIFAACRERKSAKDALWFDSLEATGRTICAGCRKTLEK